MTPITLTRFIINVMVGTLVPTLGAMQLLNATNIFNIEWWVGVLVIAITSFSAALSTQLTGLVGGNVTMNKSTN